MNEFSHIGLVAISYSQPVLESLRRIERFLTNRNRKVFLEDSMQALFKGGGVTTYSHATMAEQCDLIIAVGGDGNILRAARRFAPHEVPILGVNQGRLGFLADVSPNEIETSIGEVLDGLYTTEEHFLLEGEVSVQGRRKIPCALNEVLIHSAKLPKMLDFDLYINGIFVYNQYSDGLIVSSPTGSTAYALSAGGPIMHPSLDAIVLVPMFPHQMNNRPLVVPGDSEVKITIGSQIDINAKISFDSQLEFELEPGESLVVTKKKEKLILIHPLEHNFFAACRAKLDWASRIGG